jgi:hypothetical protein
VLELTAELAAQRADECDLAALRTSSEDAASCSTACRRTRRRRSSWGCVSPAPRGRRLSPLWPVSTRFRSSRCDAHRSTASAAPNPHEARFPRAIVRRPSGATRPPRSPQCAARPAHGRARRAAQDGAGPRRMTHLRGRRRRHVHRRPADALDGGTCARQVPTTPQPADGVVSGDLEAVDRAGIDPARGARDPASGQSQRTRCSRQGRPRRAARDEGLRYVLDRVILTPGPTRLDRVGQAAGARRRPRHPGDRGRTPAVR